MKTILLNAYAFNLRYAHALIADVEDNDMTHRPSAGFENHPAFTLGHLISGAALTVKYLGGTYDLNPEWEALFKRKGPGDPRLPEPDRTRYPSKAEILQELTRQHERVENLIRELDETKFAEPTTWRFNSYMPTLGDLIYFMCVTHESMHLGQLAAWRRAMRLPSALATL
ncbi:MAG: DinB family protein [Flavobacteriales bacterium]|nr:DinB family protein [Flavobacteriales bacterium]